MRRLLTWLLTAALLASPPADALLLQKSLLAARPAVVNTTQVTAARTAAVASLTDGSTHTWTAAAFGAAFAGRKLLIGVVGNSTNAGTTLSGVTVGGNAATSLVNHPNAVGGVRNIAAWFIYDDAVATSGDVVATFSNVYRRAYLIIYALTNASLTPTDTGFSDATPGTDTLTIANGGVAFGLVQVETTGTVWTNLTADVATLYESTTRVASAFAEFPVGGSTALTATYSGSPSAYVAAFVSIEAAP